MKKPYHWLQVLLLWGLLLAQSVAKAQNSSPAASQNSLLQAVMPAYTEHIVIQGRSTTVYDRGPFLFSQMGEEYDPETAMNLGNFIEHAEPLFIYVMKGLGVSESIRAGILVKFTQKFNKKQVNIFTGGTSEEDFTLIFTRDGMRKDTEEGTVILRLAPEGGGLQLLFRTPESLGYRGIMVPAQSLPGGSNIATTSQVAPNGPGRELLGNTAYKYSYDSEIEIPSDAITGVYKKRSQGWAWMAPEVPGADLITLFYTNLSLGGYDISGSGEAGLAGVMLRYPDAGIPLEARDVSEYFWLGGHFGLLIGISLPSDMLESLKENLKEYLYKEITTHVVTSISYELPYEDPLFLEGNPPNYEELMPTQPWAGSSPDAPETPQSPPPDLGITGVQSNAPPPNNRAAADGSGCDCSCEAYTIYKEVIATRGNSPARNEAELAANAENTRIVRCGISCMNTWINCPR